MKNKKTEANLSMIVSKTFSGLNANALKYLLPLWIAPLTGVMFRCVFAAIVFWIISILWKQEKTTRREKITLFLLGAIIARCIWVARRDYMVSCSFICLESAKQHRSPVRCSAACNRFGYSSFPSFSYGNVLRQ